MPTLRLCLRYMLHDGEPDDPRLDLAFSNTPAKQPHLPRGLDDISDAALTSHQRNCTCARRVNDARQSDRLLPA
jgi:hypothetical protein